MKLSASNALTSQYLGDFSATASKGKLKVTGATKKLHGHVVVCQVLDDGNPDVENYRYLFLSSGVGLKIFEDAPMVLKLDYEGGLYTLTMFRVGPDLWVPHRLIVHGGELLALSAIVENLLKTTFDLVSSVKSSLSQVVRLPTNTECMVYGLVFGNALKLHELQR